MTESTLTAVLDAGFFSGAIMEKGEETIGAAPVAVRNIQTSITLFKVPDGERNDLKRIAGLLKPVFSERKYIEFFIDGIGIHPLDDRCEVSLKVTDNSGSLSSLLDDIRYTLSNSAYEERFSMCEPRILLGYVPEKKDGLALLKAADEKMKAADIIPYLFSKPEKVNYAPRKFYMKCTFTDVKLLLGRKHYKTFSMPLLSWTAPDGSHKKSEAAELRRILGYEVPKPEKKDYACESSDESADNECIAAKSATLPVQESVPEPKIYLISDLHFDHGKIIQHSARPFLISDTAGMNKILINNWNRTVRQCDTVIYGGDMTYKNIPERADAFIKQLNGTMINIRGNHDKYLPKIGELLDNYQFEYGGFSFYVVHNPHFAPKDFGGWVIHGHTHNSRMNRYPFISMLNQTINISCEVVRYTPVSLDRIIEIIKICREKHIETVYSIEDADNIEKAAPRFKSCMTKMYCGY